VEAYYLVRGTTKGEMFVNILMEVVDACHNAGQEVVKPCDMSANNVMALKRLGVSEDTFLQLSRSRNCCCI
jgi:hypothetical protein